MLAFAKMSTTAEDDFETLIQIYLNRQAHLYLEHASGPYDITAEEITASRELDRYAIEERNLDMQDRSLPLLKDGSTFIAVGASHLPGDKGLVELFRKAGYEVTPVN